MSWKRAWTPAPSTPTPTTASRSSAAKAASPSAQLVLVAGPPASGKTTLATALAQALGYQRVSRDDISALLADELASALTVRSPADKRPIVNASFAVFYDVVRRLLDAGAGVVAETNFHTGPSEPALRRLVEGRHAVLVHCHATRELTFHRFRERLASGERHPYFMDEAPLAEIAAGQLPAAWSRAVPLDVGIPRLGVDTSDGYSPGLEEIATFIRSH